MLRFIIETDKGRINLDPEWCPELRRSLRELFGNLHQAMEEGKRRGRPPRGATPPSDSPSTSLDDAEPGTNESKSPTQ
jgi:hypothetical protein